MRIELAEELQAPGELVRAMVGDAPTNITAHNRILGIATDSEQICPGDLFVALRGERTCGLHFLERALARGAVAVLCDREVCLPDGVELIVHQDPQQVLLDAASRYRQQANALVVAISGSNGKTTVKEAVAAVLGGVPHSAGNFNSTLGMPLSVLSFPKAAYWVLELGINHIGEMQKMAGALAPDIGVITNVGTAHIGHFGDYGTLLSQKLAMADFLRPNGCFLLPSELPYAAPVESEGRTVRFGAGGDFFAEKIVNGPKGVQCELHGPGRVITNLTWPVPGRIGISTLTLAGAVGMLLGRSDEQIRTGLCTAAERTPRMRQIALGERLLLDDSYNASPESMMAAIETLSLIGEGRPKIAVLGDMHELGVHSAALHDALGAYVARVGDISLFTYGADAALIASGAIRNGLSRERVQHFEKDDPQALAAALCARAPRDAVMLFKASRAVGIERVLEGVRRML